MSGIQHFCFCRRQWALIHLEQQWAENLRTAEGQLLHERCHDEALHEKRGNLLTVRGLRVVSHRLHLSGICDVVEFHADPAGGSAPGVSRAVAASAGGIQARRTQIKRCRPFAALRAGHGAGRNAGL